MISTLFWYQCLLAVSNTAMIANVDDWIVRNVCVDGFEPFFISWSQVACLIYHILVQVPVVFQPHHEFAQNHQDCSTSFMCGLIHNMDNEMVWLAIYDIKEEGVVQVASSAMGNADDLIIPSQNFVGLSIPRTREHHLSTTLIFWIQKHSTGIFLTHPWHQQLLPNSTWKLPCAYSICFRI